jgi:hypothetical protein
MRSQYSLIPLLSLVPAAAFIAAIVATPTQGQADVYGPSAKLAWEYSSFDRITGFKLYGNGKVVATVPKPAVGIALSTIALPAGNYKFKVTAYSMDQESAPSNEVVLDYNPAILDVPLKLQVSFTTNTTTTVVTTKAK